MEYKVLTIIFVSNWEQVWNSSMNTDLLEETVLLMLNKELMLRGNAMKQQENLFSFQKSGIFALKNKQEEYRQEEKQAWAEKDVLYERYALMELPVVEYQKEAKKLTERLSSLSVIWGRNGCKALQAGKRVPKIRGRYEINHPFSHIKKLTQEVVATFIKRVYAYKDKRVEIEWNFSMDGEGSEAKAT